MAEIDLGRTFRPEQVIAEAIRANRLELHTMLPGRIVSYTKVDQRASIQIEIQREHQDDQGVTTTLSVPLLEDVPVVFPGAGGWSMIFPVKVGDKCLVQFCERDLRGWLTEGQEIPPGENRTHSYSDAVCHVGIRTQDNAIPNPPNNTVVLTDDGGSHQIRLGTSGIDLLTEGTIELAGDMGLDLKSDTGPFTVTAGGAITLTRGASELLNLISLSLAEIIAITVTPVTLGVAAPINAPQLANLTALKVLVDAMKAP